jgi:putative acetyltransferase
MSGEANPKLALRPMLPDEGPLLAEIFRASVADLTADDYSETQREAWMSAADDEKAFAAKRAKQLTLVATLNGSPAGFIALEGNNTVDMLYIHPAAARQGAATMLLDAAEKLATARGAEKLTVEASDTASEFFQKRGYVALQRNTITVGDEWLANTTMSKQLTAGKKEAS